MVILGQTGRNFGAGMSGGIAYVWDKQQTFVSNCNTETFELETLEAEDDIKELKQMLRNHLLYTGSTVAKKILSDWEIEGSFFLKVMPTDYKRVLEEFALKGSKLSASG